MERYRKLIIGIFITLGILTSVWITYKSQRLKNLPEQHPPSGEGIIFCNEGIRGNDCIKCSCNTASDCKLVGNPYVVSECAEDIVVNTNTTESCLKKTGQTSIHTTCIVPDNYQSPEFEVVCGNNTCGQIIK
jgi:hypothetical protein